MDELRHKARTAGIMLRLHAEDLLSYYWVALFVQNFSATFNHSTPHRQSSE
jgi:hypothetical protein